MIDNLIYDPMKQIWINLELNFGSYEFSNFKGFFSNFSEFFYIFNQFFEIFMNFY